MLPPTVEAQCFGHMAIVRVDDPESHDGISIPMEHAIATGLRIMGVAGVDLTPEVLEYAAERCSDIRRGKERDVSGRGVRKQLRRAVRAMRGESDE